VKPEENEAAAAIADLAHDFNNVLAGIRGSAQYLLKFVLPDPEGPDAAALAEHLALIDASVGKASGILNRFLASTLGREAPPSLAPATGAEKPGRRGKVIILDQDRMLRSAISKSLELSGWDVAHADDATGSEGADLVILDPRGRAADALTRIRQAAPGAKIILTPPKAEEAETPGADFVLGKPYARDELEEAIRGIGF
jgi:hypothetical protein